MTAPLTIPLTQVPHSPILQSDATAMPAASARSSRVPCSGFQTAFLSDLANRTVALVLDRRSASDAAGLVPSPATKVSVLSSIPAKSTARIPIKQVAAATGFTDPSHFGKHFFRLIGFTPRSYQRATQARHQQGRQNATE